MNQEKTPDVDDVVNALVLTNHSSVSDLVPISSTRDGQNFSNIDVSMYRYIET